jgi:hypothetical protein
LKIRTFSLFLNFKREECGASSSEVTLDSGDITIEATRGLFAGNVPIDCKAEEFVATFRRFGTVECHELLIFKATGKLHGFGFILFADHVSVKQAMEHTISLESNHEAFDLLHEGKCPRAVTL